MVAHLSTPENKNKIQDPIHNKVNTTGEPSVPAIHKCFISFEARLLSGEINHKEPSENKVVVKQNHKLIYQPCKKFPSPFLNRFFDEHSY